MPDPLGHNERLSQRPPRDTQRLQNNTFIARTDSTIGSFFAAEWLPATKTRVRPSTFDGYSDIVMAHIVPGLGAHKLQDLTPAAVNAFYAAKLEAGLAAKTVRNIHAVLRKGLSDAVRWGQVNRNVAELADPPRVRQSGDAEMKTWSASELRSFLDHTRDHPLFPAWLLAASTGLRRGELLGARWSDLDLDKGRLAVRQAVISVDDKIVFGTPKTGKGRRSVALDDGTVKVLRTHRAAQALARGEDYDDHDLIVASPKGTPIHPQTFSETFDRLVRESGLPRIRLHDLRHTHATLSLQAGVHPKVVSERLGHANISITLDTYSHAIPGMESDAAEMVAKLVMG